MIGPLAVCQSFVPGNLTAGCSHEYFRRNRSQLFERLDALERSTVVADGNSAVDETPVLDSWKDVYEDANQFEDRLRSIDISLDDCQKCLEQEEWPSDVPLPSWCDRLLQFYDTLQETTPSLEYDLTEYPFVDVLEPWISYASEH